MAEQLTITAHAIISDVEYHVTGYSAEDVQAALAKLQGGQAQQAAPQPQQAAPEATQANPTQGAGPTASGPTAPSAASPGPQAAPAPAQADTSATAPATSSVTLNDVLPPARQLLQKPNGEETLRGILAANGQEAISTAAPESLPAILAGVNQALGL